LTGLADTLAKAHGSPVLDGVTCAILLVEAMVRLGLKTSSLGGFAPPPAHEAVSFA
jgi:allantoin racemase